MQRNLEVFAFPEDEKLARELANLLDLELRCVEMHTFPDGESLIRAECGAVARVILVASLDRPNEKLIELLFAADALRRQGVERVDLVCPYLSYMRQDRVFERGQALSQRVIANLLGASFDDVLTVEAHLHRIRTLSEIFPCPARSISAAPVIAEWLRTRRHPDLILGPDAESEPWVRSVAGEANLAWRTASKKRLGDRRVELDLAALPADVERVAIVDDVGSSGATLEAIAEILRERGIVEIGAVVVHALFDSDTPERLRRAGIDWLVSTNSVSHPSNEISLAPLLAREIESPSTHDHRHYDRRNEVD